MLREVAHRLVLARHVLLVPLHGGERGGRENRKMEGGRGDGQEDWRGEEAHAVISYFFAMSDCSSTLTFVKVTTSRRESCSERDS